MSEKEDPKVGLLDFGGYERRSIERFGVGSF
jgi:hypothetical protein